MARLLLLRGVVVSRPRAEGAVGRACARTTPEVAESQLLAAAAGPAPAQKATQSCMEQRGVTFSPSTTCGSVPTATATVTVTSLQHAYTAATNASGLSSSYAASSLMASNIGFTSGQLSSCDPTSQLSQLSHMDHTTSGAATAASREQQLKGGSRMCVDLTLYKISDIDSNATCSETAGEIRGIDGGEGGGGGGGRGGGARADDAARLLATFVSDDDKGLNADGEQQQCGQQRSAHERSRHSKEQLQQGKDVSDHMTPCDKHCVAVPAAESPGTRVADAAAGVHSNCGQQQLLRSAATHSVSGSKVQSDRVCCRVDTTGTRAIGVADEDGFQGCIAPTQLNRQKQQSTNPDNTASLGSVDSFPAASGTVIIADLKGGSKVLADMNEASTALDGPVYGIARPKPSTFADIALAAQHGQCNGSGYAPALQEAAQHEWAATSHTSPPGTRSCRRTSCSSIPSTLLAAQQHQVMHQAYAENAGGGSTGGASSGGARRLDEAKQRRCSDFTGMAAAGQLHGRQLQAAGGGSRHVHGHSHHGHSAAAGSPAGDSHPSSGGGGGGGGGGPWTGSPWARSHVTGTSAGTGPCGSASASPMPLTTLEDIVLDLVATPASASAAGGCRDSATKPHSLPVVHMATHAASLPHLPSRLSPPGIASTQQHFQQHPVLPEIVSRPLDGSDEMGDMAPTLAASNDAMRVTLHTQPEEHHHRAATVGGIVAESKTAASHARTHAHAHATDTGAVAMATLGHALGTGGACSSPMHTDGKYVAAIIMEYCSDGTLESLCHRDPFNPQGRAGPKATMRGLLSLAYQVACGMAYLHSKGYMHGDLKPANVMLVRQPGHIIAKIADFGMLRLNKPTRTAASTATATAATGSAAAAPGAGLPEPNNSRGDPRFNDDDAHAHATQGGVAGARRSIGVNGCGNGNHVGQVAVQYVQSERVGEGVVAHSASPCACPPNLARSASASTAQGHADDDAASVMPQVSPHHNAAAASAHLGSAAAAAATSERQWPQSDASSGRAAACNQVMDGKENGSSGDIGTLAYCAPEALIGGGSSHAVDVYAFGMMLWQMVTGKRPYESLAPGQIMFGVSYQHLRPDWPADRYPQLRPLFEDCTREEPHARPTFDQIKSFLQVQGLATTQIMQHQHQQQSLSSGAHGGQLQSPNQNARGSSCKKQLPFSGPDPHVDAHNHAHTPAPSAAGDGEHYQYYGACKPPPTAVAAAAVVSPTTSSDHAHAAAPARVQESPTKSTASPQQLPRPIMACS